MNNYLKNTISCIVLVAVSYFVGIGIREKYDQLAAGPQKASPSPNSAPDGRLAAYNDQRPTEAGYCNGAVAPIGMQRPYVAGPLAANVGELCVFKLNDPTKRADWIIVRQSAFGPPATCYIDSSGSSLAFASNVPSQYSIIAAIVEDGEPKILTHICEYGVSPEPSPTPSPNPTPTPPPTPQPTNFGDWIKQNVPGAGRGQSASLAACYENAADGIDKGTIKTSEAAFSAIRTCTQTKIKPEIWGNFLDTLSVKIMEKQDGNSDVKKLSTIFSEIATALKAVSTPENAGDQLSEALKLPTSSPPTNFISPPSLCTDPTGKACQPTIIQTRRGNR